MQQPSSPTSSVGDTPRPAVRWQVRLLGGLELFDGRRRLNRLPSRAHVALLARLALQPLRAHGREELIELLWPGVTLEVGRNRLRQVLSTLRSVLEPGGQSPVLVADRTHLRVVTGALACDATEFERCLRAGRVAEGLAWYRGELLPGYYDEWIDDERNRLAALHDRAQDSQPEQAEPAHAPIATAPLRPAPEPATIDMARASLPHYLTPVFGAEQTGERLLELVQAARLVSVLGPGGSGKTRLVVELAHRLSDPGAGLPEPQRPFDLVLFVSLVACEERSQVLDALAEALQLGPRGGDTLGACASALAGRRALLVLDNFERIVEAAGDLVATLLARLPQLRVLVTSRRALGLDGEQQFPMPALPLPEADRDLATTAGNPAVALFVDRARAVRADFHLGPRNQSVLVSLVQALEGLPLAIELAASRVRTLAPAQMLQRFQGGGTPRLSLLARSGPRAGADPRHASMLHVVEWSWQQLGPGARGLLAALTAFPGSFTSAAAIELQGFEGEDDPALLLDELVTHSLLRATGSVEGVERFALYEPVREFARAQAQPAEAAAARARLRQWAQLWLQEMPPTPSLPALRAELPTLAAALESAVGDGAPADAMRLMEALHVAPDGALLPGHALEMALRAAEACTDPALRAQGRPVLAWQLHAAGRVEVALAQARAAVAESTQPLQRARATHVLARVLWRSSRNVAEVARLLDEAEVLLAAEPDADLRAGLLALRAFVADAGRRHEDAESLHAQALALWQRLGNQHAVNGGRYNLAVCAQNANRHALALQRLAPALASARDLRDLRRISQCLNVQGNACSGLRQWPQALAAYCECVQVAWAALAPYDLSYGFWNLPRALAHLRQPQAAQRLMGFARRFWTERFGELARADERYVERVRRLVRGQLPAGAAQALQAEGEALGLAEAVKLVADLRA